MQSCYNLQALMTSSPSTVDQGLVLNLYQILCISLSTDIQAPSPLFLWLAIGQSSEPTHELLTTETDRNTRTPHRKHIFMDHNLWTANG